MKRIRLPKPTRSKQLGGLLVLALIGLLADLITFLFLPPGAEANPVVVFLGRDISVFFKLVLITYITFLWSYLPYSKTLMMTLAIGVAAGFLGFGSNLSVLLAH